MIDRTADDGEVVKKLDYTDRDNCFWEGDDEHPGVWHWYFIEIMGFCGCYDAELMEDVIATIRAFDAENPPYYSALPVSGPDKYRELILHAMDNAGLIEHDTSIRGSWLTDKGKEVLQEIKENQGVGFSLPRADT